MYNLYYIDAVNSFDVQNPETISNWMQNVDEEMFRSRISSR